MASYKLSAKAAADIDGIYEYTILTFGLEQARAYICGLHHGLEILATHPNSGRDAADLGSGLRRYDYQMHIVFYRPARDGIQIIRVLHQSMDAKRHL